MLKTPFTSSTKFSTSTFISYLWICAGLTLPFLAITSFRIKADIYHIPIPALILGIIGIISLCYPGQLWGRIQTEKKYKIMFLLSVLIIASHIISALKASNSHYAIREVLKLVSGLACFWLLITSCLQDKIRLNLFLIATIFSTSLLLICLIIQYGFIFKAPYLGTRFDLNDVAGKNHLAWFVAVLLPYVFYLSGKNLRLTSFKLISATIFLTAIIYSMSRSAWVITVVLLAIFAIVTLVSKKSLPIKQILLVMMGVGLSLWVIGQNTGLQHDIPTRVQSIINPKKLPENTETHRLGKYSYSYRINMLKRSLTAFKQYPVRGIGLTEIEWGHFFGNSEPTHNDYATVLLETGLLGALPFYAMILGIGWILFSSGIIPYLTPEGIATTGSYAAILFLSNFINIYCSMHYWLFLGLAILVSSISKKIESYNRV